MEQFSAPEIMSHEHKIKLKYIIVGNKCFLILNTKVFVVPFKESTRKIVITSSNIFNGMNHRLN